MCAEVVMRISYDGDQLDILFVGQIDDMLT